MSYIHCMSFMRQKKKAYQFLMVWSEIIVAWLLTSKCTCAVPLDQFCVIILSLQQIVNHPSTETRYYVAVVSCLDGLGGEHFS